MAGNMEEHPPDSPSLTTFLLSFFSNPDPSSYHHSDSRGKLKPAPATNDASGSASDSQAHPNLDSAERRVHPLDSNDSSTVTSHSKSQETLQPSPETPSLKLPRMSDNSVLLAESFRAMIYLAMPIIVRDRHWILLYSTAKHGISLRTLYRKSAALSDPFLLVVRDFHGATFGGLLTAALKPTPKHKYLGTNDMFVFTNVKGSPQIFRATGANRYYLLCMNDSISLGGGGHFALHLQEDLLSGSSGACDTFGNHCLATTTEFSISKVELWGFAHASRYK